MKVSLRFRIISFIALCLVITTGAFAQGQKEGYIAPFDYKMYSSGNFGEIRSNHFHSGVDIKTGGVTGKYVRAVADGYVSRISVSPSGYGKALYIDHPHLGTTTVYGHLDNFNSAIDNYVKDQQYRRKSFALDVYPEAGRLQVKQGEMIARSGNTGSSGGPHLHYEVRDRGTQDALSVLADGYLTGIDDSTPPRFLNLYSIGIDTVKGVPVHTVTGRYTVTKGEDGLFVPNAVRIPVSKPAYFAVEVTDSKDGSANTMGIYSLEQELDGVKNFGLTINRVSFATTRYINAIIYYPLHRDARYDVLRTFRTPNNELKMYNGVVNSGVVMLSDSLDHKVEIRITDDTGQASSLVFDIFKREENTLVTAGGIPMDWSRDNIITRPGMRLTIPAKTLYESILLRFDIKEKPEGAYSPVFAIHDDNTLLQNYMTLSIVPEVIMRTMADKLCIVSRGRSGNRVYEGGTYRNGSIDVRTRSFGEYWVVMDTIAPVIAPNFPEGADMRGRGSISVIMRDNLSGIGKWQMEIDGQWALFEHDAKSNTFTHYFKDARYQTGKRHTLTIYAEDNRGNKASASTSFVY